MVFVLWLFLHIFYPFIHLCMLRLFPSVHICLLDFLSLPYWLTLINKYSVLIRIFAFQQIEYSQVISKEKHTKIRKAGIQPLDYWQSGNNKTLIEIYFYNWRTPLGPNSSGDRLSACLLAKHIGCSPLRYLGFLFIILFVNFLSYEVFPTSTSKNLQLFPRGLTLGYWIPLCSCTRSPMSLDMYVPSG